MKSATSLVQTRSPNVYVLYYLLANHGTVHLSLVKSPKDQKEEGSEPEVTAGAISSQGQKGFAHFDKIGFR